MVSAHLRVSRVGSLLRIDEGVFITHTRPCRAIMSVNVTAHVQTMPFNIAYECWVQQAEIRSPFWGHAILISLHSSSQLAQLHVRLALQDLPAGRHPAMRAV